MAALVLSVAGGAAGAVFGPAGAIAGRIAGALIGNIVDQSLFTSSQSRSVQGPRLADLDVMASTEGAPIPRVYGRARLAGQLIWATRFEEVVSTRTETSGGGGKGGLVGGGGGGATSTVTTTTYSYFANFAVGLCEGEIGHVGRIWADGQPLDISGLTLRVHRGGEDQLADDLIVAKEGSGNAPAYRGLAYVVFERLALESFGNRIPQLSFEIVRPIGKLERMARAVTLIPGTTEFGYDTNAVVRVLGPGQSAPENRHVHAPSDVIASLDDLQATCPNLERVAIVVAWFGSDLRAAHCVVRPGVDSAIKVTSGGAWSVAGIGRDSAYVVSSVEGRPAFGGTPSDDSLRHLIAELKARGIKITLYPFLMMDIAPDNALADPWSGASLQPPYPWRGRITCDPAPGASGSVDGTSTAATQVAHFFAGSGAGDWSYRRMILHYAALAASCGGVDAFLIGSELKALTRVCSASGVYPAVNALVTLAGDVRSIVGSSTIITYGADWTEYGAHVVDDDASEVRFPLDALWASSAIDVVGIDYYAPLSDWRDEAGHLDALSSDSIYDVGYLRSNLNAGEGYDWYYAAADARADQDRTPITDGLSKPWLFRAKDVRSWWSNAHHERLAGAELTGTTAWIAKSKPIWFTEIGCPAVDKGANQPSVFPDAKSSEGNVPYFSNGQRDDLIQRRYLEAVIGAFDPAFGGNDALNPPSTIYDGRMIDPSGLHVWTWDARPYPVFPAAEDVWSDAPNWQTGHWLTGRLGAAPLDALAGAILADSNVTGVDCDGLRDSCDGYVVDRPMTPRAMIDPLAMAYAFDATIAGGDLTFIQRGGAPVMELAEDDLVDPPRGALSRLTRSQETELPRETSFGFTDAASDYRRSAVTSRRLVGGSNRTLHSDFAVITNDAAATRRADVWLQDLWAGRESAEFSVGMDCLALTPGDVIAVTINARRRLFEIGELVDTQSRQIKARSIDPEIFSVPLRPQRQRAPAIPSALGPVQAMMLDLPAIDASDPPILSRLAIFADPWPGSVTIWRSAGGSTFQPAAVAFAPSVMGETLDPLPRGPTSRWDRGSRMRVRLYGGALASMPDARVLENANAAAILTPDGGWEIFQFVNAELVAERTYLLSRLLRGQAGSEYAIADPLPAGAPFVMLDDHVTAIARGLGALDRAVDLRIVASGRSHDDPSAVSLSVTPRPTALMPLSPVHIKAARQADGVHISWIRRTRRDGDGWNVEVPLGEDTEAYMIEIMSGSSVLRSFSCASPMALYANASELSDFGAPQTMLHLRVVQLSAAVGRGHPTEVTLTI